MTNTQSTSQGACIHCMECMKHSPTQVSRNVGLGKTCNNCVEYYSQCTANYVPDTFMTNTKQTMEEPSIDYKIESLVESIVCTTKEHKHKALKQFITSELRLLLMELVEKKRITIEDAIDGGEHISDVVLFEDILSSFRKRGVELGE